MLNEVIANCYQIVEKIGEGGMGEVFRGVDIDLDRDVAIKVIRTELVRRPEILQRFRKEAVVLAKLNHSNIATLYNFVHDGNNYYMVMEFAPGQTLDILIADYVNGLPWQYALDLFMDALRAIDHAHKQGIIHRDIKPHNMMVSERDTLKVLDFGIARVLGESGFTKAGIVIGTTKYMSPEQILGRSIDTRSDIYALGIVLYKMLTGHVPFEGLGDFELMKAQVEERVVPVRQIIPDLPEAVDVAIMRSLEKAPEDRFQKASEFAAALLPALRDLAQSELGEAISPDADSDRRRAFRQRGAHKLVTDGNLAHEQTDIPTASSPRPVVPSPPTRVPHRSEAPTDTGITSSTDLDDPTLARKRALLKNELRDYFEDTTPDKTQLPPRSETPRKSEDPENSRILPRLADPAPLRKTRARPAASPAPARPVSAAPQTAHIGQPSIEGDTSASKAPPADRTSVTTGARPGR